MEEKKKMLVMRLFVAFFVIVSAVIAIIKDKYGFTFIAQMMGVSWGALAGAFLAPFMYGLYMKRVSKAAVWASFIVGVGLTVSNMFLKFIASPINCGAIAMIIGLIIVPIISYLTPKPKIDVDSIFSCYDEKVVVHSRTSIGE